MGPSEAGTLKEDTPFVSRNKGRTGNTQNSLFLVPSPAVLRPNGTGWCNDSDLEHSLKACGFKPHREFDFVWNLSYFTKCLTAVNNPGLSDTPKHCSNNWVSWPRPPTLVALGVNTWLRCFKFWVRISVTSQGVNHTSCQDNFPLINQPWVWILEYFESLIENEIKNIYFDTSLKSTHIFSIISISY